MPVLPADVQRTPGEVRRRLDAGCWRTLGSIVCILSEQDRIGIGTFQPKDEKNQDSTELTGDINYRKIAEYGTDSDPRCVAAETIIATGEGLVPVADLMPRVASPDTFVPRPLAVTTIGNSRVGLADSVYFGGSHPLCSVQTRLGYRVARRRTTCC